MKNGFRSRTEVTLNFCVRLRSYTHQPMALSYSRGEKGMAADRQYALSRKLIDVQEIRFPSQFHGDRWVTTRLLDHQALSSKRPLKASPQVWQGRSSKPVKPVDWFSSSLGNRVYKVHLGMSVQYPVGVGTRASDIQI